MPRLKCDDPRLTGLYTPLRITGVPIVATTLGEAIAVAETLIGCRITLHEPPKYFRIHTTPTEPGKYLLFDIHIERAGAEICPKQDLEFPIYEDDLVHIASLIC